MIERILHAFCGAFLGAAIAIGILVYVEGIQWAIVAAAAGICGVLAFAWGEPVLDWLKKIWWWS